MLLWDYNVNTSVSFQLNFLFQILFASCKLLLSLSSAHMKIDGKFLNFSSLPTKHQYHKRNWLKNMIRQSDYIFILVCFRKQANSWLSRSSRMEKVCILIYTQLLSKQGSWYHLYRYISVWCQRQWAVSLTIELYYFTKYIMDFLKLE